MDPFRPSRHPLTVYSNFITWVQEAFRSRNIRVDALLLSPRLSEAAVIKRQIIEGVVAVSRLTRANQQSAKIPIQVFDRRGGADVRFEEYADLEPSIAAEVVLRAKTTAATAMAAPTYGYGYGAGAPAPAAAGLQAGAPPNLGNIITSLDSSGLQKLLGAMQNPNTAHNAQQLTQQALAPDLAKLLGSAGGLAQPGGYSQAPSQDPLAALRNNPALAGLLGAQATPQPATPRIGGGAPPPQGQPDMADILARLGSYRR